MMMMNFGGRPMDYWNQFSVNTQHLDELLSKDDAPLEEVIDDENVIGELKNLNPRLLNYFTIDKIKSLVEYIITEPPNDATSKRAYKFPFVACELLICESNTILDSFFMREDYTGEESIPEIDDSEHPSENQEEPGNPKENEEIEEPKKKSLREEDFCEFTVPKTSSKKEDSDIIWHTEDNLNEKTEEKCEYNIEDKGEVKAEERNEEITEEKSEDKTEEKTEEKEEEKDDKGKLETYEIKIKNYDEEKKLRKKEKKEAEEMEEKKRKEEKKVINRFMLLDYLFSFIENDQELNVTLAGYFAKVFLSFFNKKQKELIEYVFERPKVCENILNHLISRSISEILLKLVTFESSDTNNYMEMRTDITKKLVDLINENQDFELNSNIYWILIELAKNATTNRVKELLNFLMKGENVSILLDKILTQNHALVMNSCLFLSMIFSIIITSDIKHPEDEATTIQTTNEIKLCFDEFTELFSIKISSLIDFIDQELDIAKFQTTYGLEIHPIGLCKIKLIEIIGNSLRLNNMKINQAVALRNFFSKIMRLFLTFEWNNLLHNEVEKILTYALESDSNILKISIFKDAQFLDFLNEAAELCEFRLHESTNKKIRAGFCGHLTKIGNNFVKLSEKDDDLKAEMTDERWITFNEKFLSVSNENNNRDIGGHNSMRASKFEKDFDEAISYEKAEIENKFKGFLTNSAGKKKLEMEEKFPELEELNDSLAFWQNNGAQITKITKSPKKQDDDKEDFWKPAEKKDIFEETQIFVETQDEFKPSKDLWSNIFASPPNLPSAFEESKSIFSTGFEWTTNNNNVQEEKKQQEKDDDKNIGDFTSSNYWKINNETSSNTWKSLMSEIEN